ncbi:MAG: hypothetical protein GY868_15600 [Deltaproteobacteria bacterium]|nr:hypothetical protein [Deltaproteobacteria bacterium]
MKAKTYGILKKKRWFPEALASLNDFKLKAGPQIDAADILRNPNISIYCLDPKNEQVIFVETPPGLNLTDAAFIYNAQYENAFRVITIPFAETMRIAGPLPDPDQNIIFLYTVGRAGSTLLCKIFEGDADTISLSEPDIFACFVPLIKNSAHKKEGMQALMQACTKILFAGSITRNKKNVLIKPRGICIEIAVDIRKALPRSKIIFLYRNAQPVIESYIRAFTGGRVFHLLRDLRPSRKLMQFMVKKNQRSLSCFFPHVTERHIDLIAKTGLEGALCATWLSIMKTYCALHRNGSDTIAVIYEDIVSHSRDIITQLFRGCRISEASVDTALQALGKDSQEDTRLARKLTYKKKKYLNIINPDHLQMILKTESEINSADYVVPGTITPGPGQIKTS